MIAAAVLLMVASAVLLARSAAEDRELPATDGLPADLPES